MGFPSGPLDESRCPGDELDTLALHLISHYFRFAALHLIDAFIRAGRQSNGRKTSLALERSFIDRLV